ncbi:GNAT family N-acetyltransferase [Thalassotalea sp. G2M2-11]|uniref:GNAT family N-acetyltransferase n=1 Tax=Thalassotalea sp. G2M2-11 TaxID=2787627 RepID=UPI0019D11E52|nr:GNAT family N-acetyltransferase [Thalassotalea sp. G2M2-11]
MTNVHSAKMFTGFGIELTPLTLNDIEQVRQWRNHPDITKYMVDQSYINTEQQQQWFHLLSNRDDQQYLMISYKQQHIGVIYGKSLTSEPLLIAETIELGLYLDPESKYRNSILAFSPSLVFIHYLFHCCQCRKLLAHVLPHNQSAIRYNTQLGYEITGTDESGMVIMELNQANFDQAKMKLAKILRF